MNEPILFTLNKHSDNRGEFCELFNDDKNNCLNKNWVQVNHSFSKKNVLRGIHTQLIDAKLVSVIHGAIYDVIVDLRIKKDTFGEWKGFELNNSNQLYIPPGFGHSFFVISDNANVIYQTSELWDKNKEVGII